MTRPASREAIHLGCPLLLQMWIHERFDISRPKTDLSEYEAMADDTDPADLPTMGSLWCLRKHVWAGEQPKKTYRDFVCQINWMVDAQVRWTSYAPAIIAARSPQGLSSLCSRDQAYWLTRQRLVFDVYVEEYAIHRVMRQFGLFQAAPVPVAPRLPPSAHRWTRKGVAAATSFFDRLQPYVAEWASAAHKQNVVTEHRLHDAAVWVAYLRWYLPRMRTRGDVRACYRATATCAEPRQGTAGRDLPGAPRPDRRHSARRAG